MYDNLKGRRITMSKEAKYSALQIAEWFLNFNRKQMNEEDAEYITNLKLQKLLLYSWNADGVGAFNILRLYFQTQKIDASLDPTSILSPEVMKVAA